MQIMSLGFRMFSIFTKTYIFFQYRKKQYGETVQFFAGEREIFNGKCAKGHSVKVEYV